jgi:hypothetical protein
MGLFLNSDLFQDFLPEFEIQIFVAVLHGNCLNVSCTAAQPKSPVAAAIASF